MNERTENTGKPDKLHGLLCLHSNRPVDTLDKLGNGSLVLGQVIAIPDTSGSTSQVSDIKKSGINIAGIGYQSGHQHIIGQIDELPPNQI